MSDTVRLIAALGHPGAGARTGGACSAPHARAVIAREPALTVGALIALRDCDLNASVGRDPSGRFAFIDHVAIDDPHAEPVAWLAGAAAGDDRDAPGTVEVPGRAFGACVEVALRRPPLSLGAAAAIISAGLLSELSAGLLGGLLASLAGRAELATILVNGARPLRKCLSCHQRADADEQAQ